MSEIVDEDVSAGARPTSTARAAGQMRNALPVHEEVVDTEGRITTVKQTADEDTIAATSGGRRFTEKQLALIEAAEKRNAALRAGVDPDDVQDDETVDGVAADGETAEEVEDPDDKGLVEGEEAAPTEPAEGETKVEAKPAATDADFAATMARLEATNRDLLARAEAAEKRPAGEVPARFKALDEAERAYVDEGPVAAFRKFLAVVLDAAPDSPEVDRELSGAYADLTARELGVPLQDTQQAIREAARARLALARDKRERKAEGETKPAQPQDDAGVVRAAAFIDSQLPVAGPSGKSLADDHPMLMALSEEFDGVKPGELLARAIHREIQIGSLDPKLGDAVMIATVAKKIESYYSDLADKIVKVKTATASKTDTTKSSATQAAAPVKTSTEQRQQTEARTITTKDAGKAPATPPKTNPKQPTEMPKFKSEKERKEFLLRKHFPNG